MKRWTESVVAWTGGVFIASIIALASYDIFDSYQVAVSDTRRDLDAQARILAEQTARSLQAVDVVLRHLVQQHRQGALDAMGPNELHAYLREQAVGLAQIAGLVLVDPSGAPRAVSDVHPVPEAARNVASLSIFTRLRSEREPGLYIEDAMQSMVDRAWMFPLARRLEGPGGEFAGGVGARGRVDYFEQFYRNVRLDPSTTINLMRDNGSLLARHPRVESALGQRFPLFDQVLAMHNAGAPAPVRATSPIDGVERFVSLKLVADYPLAIVVTRDVNAALAPWRARSLGSALRTLALSALAGLLLFFLTRQLARLHKARESLEVSRERYSVAVAGSDDGIFDWDYRSGKAFGSARAREILGLPPGPEMQTLEEWFAALERQFHPADLPRRLEAIRAHLAGEIPAYEGEFRVRDGQGGYRWVRIRGMCVRKGAGKPHRMAGSIADIDAHKRAQQALRESEERFALAVAGSNDGIVDWDVANDRMYSSERAMQILGIDSTQTLRTRAEWSALVKYHPDDVARMKADLADFLQGRTEMRDGEYRILLPSGDYRWIRHRNKCVRDAGGRPMRVAGSVSDIDGQKRAEEALRASEEQYRAIFNGSADALILRDGDNRIVDVNPAFLELNGLTRDEAMSERTRIFARGEDAPMVREMYRRVLAGETVRYELQFVRKNGVPFDIEIRMMPVQYRGRTHSLSMARDITAQKRAEAALRASEERFALAVAGSNDGIMDWDIATDRMYTSERAMQILHIDAKTTVRTRDELHALIRYHPDDAPRVRADLDRLLEGRSELRDDEYRIEVGGGRQRWIRYRHKCVRDAAGRAVRIAGSVSDIDAQKRVEEALRASEEQYRAIFNAAADALVLRDAEANVVDVNPAFLHISGYAREEVVGSSRWVFAVPEMRALGADMHRRVIAGESVRFEVEAQRKDGRRIDVEMRAVPIRYRGAPHALGMARDITAQKQAEAALRSSEEQYRAVFNGAAEALVLRDAESRVIDVNPAFVELTGYRREDIVGTGGWTFAGPEGRDAARRVHQRVISGESLHFEVQTRRKDGSVIDLDVRAVPISHLGRPHTLAMARDITEQKRAAAALRASEERYQLAVAGANQGLWDWDLASDTMFVSARAQAFMGLEPGEPLRARREWIALSAYHPDDVDAVRSAISDHLKGKTAFCTVDYRLRHPSGNWHWYRQRGVALRAADGRPYRMAGSMEDITAQKDLEGQLLQAKKLEAIGTLAGGIAHDFNNILAAILGYGEMAQKSASPGTALKRHVDAVVSAGQRAKSLVERILAFSRSGIGERKPVNVQSVVAEALDLVGASLPKHVVLERALCAADAAVMGDATQIHQVVMNLCANAAQAMKSAGTVGVSLDVVEKPAFRAATSALPAGRYVRLAVRDSGSGIPAQILERIFDPFFTTKDVGVGTGLGLSLVHGIVTDLGGGIEVESRPGEGALFNVYLPYSSAVVVSAAATEALPEGSGESVLIVDDEEPLVRLAEEMIAGLGYEPVGFASSAAALESFRASPERFHAVLTDESMPELTGSELAREIRQLRPDIPIVIVSGVVTPGLAARARELGAAQVLAKPLAERDLARSLAAALNTVKGEIHE